MILSVSYTHLDVYKRQYIYIYFVGLWIGSVWNFRFDCTQRRKRKPRVYGCLLQKGPLAYFRYRKFLITLLLCVQTHNAYVNE